MPGADKKRIIQRFTTYKRDRLDPTLSTINQTLSRFANPATSNIMYKLPTIIFFIFMAFYMAGAQDSVVVRLALVMSSIAIAVIAWFER